MKSHFLSRTIFLITATVACVGRATTVEPYVRWPANENPVRVCFASWENDESKINPDLKENIDKSSKVDWNKSRLQHFNENMKTYVQNVVESEFTATRTSISFEGWKDCKDDDEAVLGIFPIFAPTISSIDGGTSEFEAIGGESSVGKNMTIFEKLKNGEFSIYKKPKGVLEKLFWRSSTRPGMTTLFINVNVLHDSWIRDGDDAKPRLFVLHEFGHAAGLAHEFRGVSKKEIDSNRSCQRLGLTHKDLKEQVFGSSKRYSIYDVVSVMDYCYVQRVSGFGSNYELNPGDTKNDKYFYRSDSTIFRESKSDGTIKIDIHFGLSQGDIHGLRCLYDQAYFDLGNCKPEFNPNAEIKN